MAAEGLVGTGPPSPLPLCHLPLLAATVATVGLTQRKSLQGLGLGWGGRPDSGLQGPSAWVSRPWVPQAHTHTHIALDEVEQGTTKFQSGGRQLNNDAKLYPYKFIFFLPLIPFFHDLSSILTTRHLHIGHVQSPLRTLWDLSLATGSAVCFPGIQGYFQRPAQMGWPCALCLSTGGSLCLDCPPSPEIFLDLLRQGWAQL